MSTAAVHPRPALTSPGVIILQSVAIFLAVAIDLAFSASIGLITGITLAVAFAGGAMLARPRARSWSAITPPLALVVSLAALLPTLGTSSLSPARLAVDLINALAAIAPYLVLGASATWAYVLVRARR
jgi:hypothetical protein